MKKFLVAMGLVAFAVVGCAASSSASAGPNDEPGVESSSSSVTPQSSSSSTSVSSSSSVEEPPTSSETESSSSSSEDKINCSALLEGETGWSWDVPKECRFNPDIDYGTMTDERDGKVYRTVKIGNLTWMAENLNFDAGQGGSGEDEYEWSWCFNDEPKNCAVGGRLYTWAAAIDSVKLANDPDNLRDCGYGKVCSLPDTVYGICPPGWHLPSKAEFEYLFTAVGGQSAAASVLKSQSGWGWRDNGNGTDAFGFSALPAGDYSYGSFYNDGAYFWSSTEDDDYDAYNVGLRNDKRVHQNRVYKSLGLYVRCVKNE